MLNDLGDSNLWFKNKSVIYTLFSSSKGGDGKNCYLIKMRNEMSVKSAYLMAVFPQISIIWIEIISQAKGLLSFSTAHMHNFLNQGHFAGIFVTIQGHIGWVMRIF